MTSIVAEVSSSTFLDVSSLERFEEDSTSSFSSNEHPTFQKEPRKLGTRLILMSEVTLGEKLNVPTHDNFYKVLNYLFIFFFLCYVSYYVTGIVLFIVLACCSLLLSEAIILLNLRLDLMRFQFESMEFCWLLFSSCVTFVVAASLNRFRIMQTTVLFCFYSVYVAIIFFDCLHNSFRSTSKWVFLVSAAACLMHAMILELASESYVETQWNLHVFEFHPSGVDSWTNLELYVRLNFIQTFFCLKMWYHLHFFPQFSYFVTERRKNVNYEQYSLRTFRSYQAYLKSIEDGEGPEATEIDAIDLKYDMDELKDDLVAEQMSTIERIESTEKRSPSLRAQVDGTGPSTLQIPVSDGKSRITMSQTSSSGSLGTSEQYVFGIPRSATVRLFNLFTVWLLLGHIISIIYSSVVSSVMVDFSMGTLGLICLLNMRFDKYKMLLSDVEYYYLILSCLAAWFFACDLRNWEPLWVFRSAVTWISIGTFCHFDVLLNELKQTLKYGLLIGVVTLWLLIAWVNMQDTESIHENFHIRSWDISRIDTWTNLEFYVRISFVLSLFWLKLAYHLWYFEEYFYFNRVYVNTEEFLSTSTLDLYSVKIQTPNTVAAQNAHTVLSE